MSETYNRHTYYRRVYLHQMGYDAAASGEPYNPNDPELYRRGWICYNLDLLKQHGSLLVMQGKCVALTTHMK